MTTEVVLVDAEPNGLAELVARLIAANLERRPDRARLVRPAVVVLDATDADVIVSVRMRPGAVEVANGAANPGADLEVHAPSRDLLALASTSLRMGVPDPLRRDGRAMLRRVMGGQVRIEGMVRHPIALSRFARLLSVTS